MNDPAHTINDQILDRWNGQWWSLIVFILYMPGKKAHNCVMLTLNYAFGPINDLHIIILTWSKNQGTGLPVHREVGEHHRAPRLDGQPDKSFIYSRLWVVFKSSTNAIIAVNKMHFVWGSDTFSFKDKLGQQLFISTASDKRTSETSTTFSFSVQNIV